MIVLTLVAMGLAGCDQSHFKVEARLDGLGNQNMRVVFAGDSGLTDTWLPAHDGRLRFKGASGRLTLLSLISTDGTPLAMLAVQNGETIKLTGDISQPAQWKVSGSDLNRRWWDFKKAHAALYADRGTRRDEVIEKYAAQHPDDVLSAILLLCDHTHVPQSLERVSRLIAALSPQARAQTVLDVFDQMAPLVRRANLRVQPMLLYNRARKDFVSLDAHGKPLLLYLWTNSQPDRAAQVRLLRDFWRQAADSVVIADINIEADTTMWQSTLLGDSAQWQHYWAPGGPEDVAIKPLNVMYTPLYIATDTLGNQVYRGDDVRAAISACRP